MIQISPQTLSSMAFLALPPQRGIDGAGVVEKESRIQSGREEKTLSKERPGPRLESTTTPSTRGAQRIAQDTLSAAPTDSSEPNQDADLASKPKEEVKVHLSGSAQALTVAAELASQAVVLPQQTWNPIESVEATAETVDAVTPAQVTDAEELALKVKYSLQPVKQPEGFSVVVDAQPTVANFDGTEPIKIEAPAINLAGSGVTDPAPENQVPRTATAPTNAPNQDLMDWKAYVNENAQDLMDWDGWVKENAQDLMDWSAMPADDSVPNVSSPGISVPATDSAPLAAIDSDDSAIVGSGTVKMPPIDFAQVGDDIATGKELQEMMQAVGDDLMDWSMYTSVPTQDVMDWSTDSAVEEAPIATPNADSNDSTPEVKVEDEALDFKLKVNLNQKSDGSSGLDQANRTTLQTGAESATIEAAEGVELASSVVSQPVKAVKDAGQTVTTIEGETGLLEAVDGSSVLDHSSSSNAQSDAQGEFGQFLRSNQEISIKNGQLGAPERTLNVREVNAVVKQVADRIELLIAAKPKQGITIHLDPGDLGKVTIVVKSQGKDVEAQILTNNENVRQAIVQAKTQLIEQLDQRGFSLATVTVGQEPAQQQTNMDSQARAQAEQVRTMLGRSDNLESDSVRTMTAEQMRSFVQRATGVDYWI